MENQEIIRLQNIAVSFDGEKVLDDFSLSIRNGEFVTLLGPSGCGKTTTLRIIGGFVTPDEGDVFLTGSSSPNSRRTNATSIRFFSGMRCFLI